MRSSSRFGGVVRSLLVSSTVLIVLVISSWFLWVHATWLKDQWTAWQFTPSSEVATSRTRTGMTDHAVFLTEATRAKFADADTFNKACRGYEKSGDGSYTTLGCYTMPLDEIVVYRIQDVALEGIDDVVLVHEMLHAAWDRLSTEERAILGQQLEVAYAEVRTKELESRMAHYAKAEPGERINELHSILATEFSQLTPQLEDYYSRYFKDRRLVVALYKKYNEPFRELQQKLALLAVRITAAEEYLAKESAMLTQNIMMYDKKLAVLRQERAALNRTSQEDVAAYNAKVNELNDEASRLNQWAATIRQRYNLYIADIREYNATSIAFNKLQASLDSTSIPTVEESR